MPLFNPLEYLLQLDLIKYVLISMSFYGLNLALKKLIKGRNPL